MNSIRRTEQQYDQKLSWSGLVFSQKKIHQLKVQKRCWHCNFALCCFVPNGLLEIIKWCKCRVKRWKPHRTLCQRGTCTIYFLLWCKCFFSWIFAWSTPSRHWQNRQWREATLTAKGDDTTTRTQQSNWHRRKLPSNASYGTYSTWPEGSLLFPTKPSYLSPKETLPRHSKPGGKVVKNHRLFLLWVCDTMQ